MEHVLDGVAERLGVHEEFEVMYPAVLAALAPMLHKVKNVRHIFRRGLSLFLEACELFRAGSRSRRITCLPPLRPSLSLFDWLNL